MKNGVTYKFLFPVIATLSLGGCNPETIDMFNAAMQETSKSMAQHNRDWMNQNYPSPTSYNVYSEYEEADYDDLREYCRRQWEEREVSCVTDQ